MLYPGGTGLTLLIVGTILMVVVCLFLYLPSSSIVKSLYGIINNLEGTTNSVALASHGINNSSQAVECDTSEQATKNTANLIEDIISKVSKGETIAKNSNENFYEVAEANDKVSALVSEISTASSASPRSGLFRDRMMVR